MYLLNKNKSYNFIYSGDNYFKQNLSYLSIMIDMVLKKCFIILITYKKIQVSFFRNIQQVWIRINKVNNFSVR